MDRRVRRIKKSKEKEERIPNRQGVRKEKKEEDRTKVRKKENIE